MQKDFLKWWMKEKYPQWRKDLEERGIMSKEIKIDKNQLKEFEDEYGKIDEYFNNLSLKDLKKIAKMKDTYIKYQDIAIDDLEEVDRKMLASTIVGEYSHKALVLKKAIEKLNLDKK